jgi:S1-C subfamily serine protease
MSARVKGGSSGGPVINKLGEVIGMISASRSSDRQEIDRLGFATDIASSETEEIANEAECVGQVNFQVVEGHLEARTERAVARLKVERIHFRKKIQP